jgi:hypothetical protein
MRGGVGAAAHSGLMFIEAAVDGARWVLLVVFALSSVEKIGVLRSRTAEWHPLMLVTPWRRRHAKLLVASSLVADLAAVALLLIRPGLGSWLTAVLLVTYTVTASRAHYDTGDCQCFWKLLNARTTLGLITRNALLMGLVPLALLGAPQEGKIAPLIIACELLLVGLITRLADLAVLSAGGASSTSTSFSVGGTTRAGLTETEPDRR